jgi:acetyl-CoA carboxylase biotin carboxyl carrier protein
MVEGGMELKHIKELMAAMGRTGTKRLILKKDDVELHLEREENGNFRGVDHPIELGEDLLSPNEAALRRASIALSRAKETASSLSGTPPTSPVEKEEVASVYVTSPMVGTFYSSPSPEDPSFVKVGDKIDKNTVVCIIEAMKVMNEVKAGVAGTVSEILVETGHPVEFGTKLFRIT